MTKSIDDTLFPKRSKKKEALTSLGMVIGGVSLGFLVSAVFPKMNIIPGEEYVQEGFVPPADIKIFNMDTDKDGEVETYIAVQNFLYPIMESDGRPVLSSRPVARLYKRNGKLFYEGVED